MTLSEERASGVLVWSPARAIGSEQSRVTVTMCLLSPMLVLQFEATDQQPTSFGL